MTLNKSKDEIIKKNRNEGESEIKEKNKTNDVETDSRK